MKNRDRVTDHCQLTKRTGDGRSNLNILKGLMAIMIALFLVVGLFPTPLTKTSVYAADVEINAANFPDEKFRDYVKAFDEDSNGSLSDAERAKVTKITINNQGCTSLKGIEHF